MKLLKGIPVPKKWMLIGLAVVALLALSVIKEQRQGRVVNTAVVDEKDLEAEITAIGTVEAGETEVLYALDGGVVADLAVKEGDRVPPNQVIIRLVQSERAEQVNQAKAALAAAKAALSGLPAREKEIAAVKNEVKNTETALAAARRNLAQAEAMAESGAVSKEDVTQAAERVKVLEESLSSAVSRLDALQVAYNADTKALQAQAEQAESVLRLAENAMGKTEIKNTLAGTVLELLVKEGQPLLPGTPVAKIGSIDTFLVTADVLAEDFPKVKVGQQVRLTGSQIDDQEIKGIVESVAPQAVITVSKLGTEERRVPVKIRVKSSLLLLPGMTVEAHIITDKKENVVALPQDAVFELPDGKWAFFAVDQGKAVLHTFEKGLENEDFIEMKGAKEGGFTVILDPPDELKPGERVTIKS